MEKKFIYKGSLAYLHAVKASFSLLLAPATSYHTLLERLIAILRIRRMITSSFFRQRWLTSHSFLIHLNV